MDRRHFLGGLLASGALSFSTTRASGAIDSQQRAMSATSAERLIEVLSLVPDTPNFRRMRDSDLRWVDVKRQADALGLPVVDAINDSTANWPQYVVSPLRSNDSLGGTDSVLSIGERDPFGQLCLWTGADTGSVAEHLRRLEFETIDLGNMSVFLQRELDLRRVFLGDGFRFFAIHSDQSIVAFASSEDLILEYVGSVAGNHPSLADAEDHIILPMVKETPWTQTWLSGDLLNRSSAPATNAWYFLEGRTVDQVNTILSLSDVEMKQSGMYPRVVHFAVGQDAGYTPRNLRDPDEPLKQVVQGYAEPHDFLALQFETEADAELACEIIDWRWETSHNWSGDKSLMEQALPLEIDKSKISKGIIRQEFGDRGRWSFAFLNKLGLVIYGWGNL